MHYGIFLLLLFTTVNLAAKNKTSVSVFKATPPPKKWPSFYDLLKDVFGSGSTNCEDPENTLLEDILFIFGIRPKKPECVIITTPKPQETIFERVKRYLEEIKPFIEMIVCLLKYILGIGSNCDYDTTTNPLPIMEELKAFIDECRPYVDIILLYIKYICQCGSEPVVIPNPPKIVIDIKAIVDAIRPSFATILEFIKKILGIGSNDCVNCCNNQEKKVVVDPQTVVDALEKIFGNKIKDIPPSKDLVIKSDTKIIIDGIKKYFGGKNAAADPTCSAQELPVYVTLGWNELINGKENYCEKGKKTELISPTQKTLNELFEECKKLNNHFMALKDETVQRIEHLYEICARYG